MDDDKVDYRASPVRTHLQMTPSEEHVLPERRQVLEEYEQAAWKSNRRRASYGQASVKSHEASTR